ncbi:MAG: hypothetical protein ACI8PT_004462 [Gammaproteobacteria bacterium]|jgi:hypothetical protein
MIRNPHWLAKGGPLRNHKVKKRVSVAGTLEDVKDKGGGASLTYFLLGTHHANYVRLVIRIILFVYISICYSTEITSQEEN